MASGSFSTKWKGYTYKVEWSSTSNVTANTSTVTCTHKLICDASYGLNIGTRANKCTIDGTVVNFTSSSISTSGNSTHTLGTTTHTVTHNNDGTKTASFSADFYLNATISGTYKGYISISDKTITLDNIPREPTASCSVVSSTIRENTATINWSSDSTIKEVDYSINGASYVKYTGYSGGSKSGSLTGLTFNVNTSNTIKVKLIRADNNLYKESNTVTVPTTDWPKATGMTNFTIGTGPTIILSNPHNRNITLNIKQTSTNTLLGSYSGTANGNITGSTSGSNFNTTASINNQYNSIPASISGTYYCEVIYSGYSTKTFTGDSNTNKYSIKGSSDEKPTLAASVVTAENTSITSIAGTNYFLQDHNSLKIKITSQMTTNKGASKTGSSNTSARYVVSGSGLTTWTKLAKDLSTTTFYTISGKITGSSFTITVYDDRNQSSSVSIPVNYVSYTNPTSNEPILKRENGITDKVLATISGTYKNWSGMATTNSIQSVQYKIPGVVSSYTNWPGTITSSNGTWSCPELLLSQTFSISQSYSLYLRIADKVGTASSTTEYKEYGPYKIGTADALLWRDLANKRLGIRTKPDYTLHVNGDIYTDAKYRIRKGSSYGIYNTDGNLILSDYGNNNVVLNAATGTLFLGYANTTAINILNGKATINSNGAYSGNAATATKLGTSTVGSATKPIYLNGGTPTACNNYPTVNNTKLYVKINGSSKGPAYINNGSDQTVDLGSGYLTSVPSGYPLFTSLYGNDSGTNGTVTLSANLFNYPYILILMKDNNEYGHQSLMIKTATLSAKKVIRPVIAEGYVPSDSAVNFEWRSSQYSISSDGKTLTVSNSTYLHTRNNTFNNYNKTAYVYIYKVFGISNI